MALKDRLKKALLSLPKVSTGVSKWLGFPEPKKKPIDRLVQSMVMPAYFGKGLIRTVNIPSYFVGGTLKSIREDLPKTTKIPSPTFLIGKGLESVAKRKTDVLTELPKTLRIPETKKKTRAAIGLAGEFATPGMPVATPVFGMLLGTAAKPLAKLTKPLQKYGDDIFRFVVSKIKKIEPGEVTYLVGKNADDLLKKLRIPKKALSEIKSGKPIELDDILVQYQSARGGRPQRLMVSNISRKLEKIAKEVKPKLKVKLPEKPTAKLKVEKPLAKLKVPKLPQEKEYIKSLEEIKAGKDIEKIPDIMEEINPLEQKIRKTFAKFKPEVAQRKQKIYERTKELYNYLENLVNPSKAIRETREDIASIYSKARERFINSDNPVVRLFMRWGPKDPELRDAFINKLFISGGMKDFSEVAVSKSRREAAEQLARLGKKLDNDILADIVWGVRKAEDFKMDKETAAVYQKLADDIHTYASLPAYAQMKLEDEWLRQGLIKERTFVDPETFAKNIDKYLRTVYDENRRLVEKVWGIKGDKAKTFVKLGLPTSWAKAKIPLEKWGKKALELRMKAEGATDEAIKKAIKETPEEELKQIGAVLKEKTGWIKDPFKAFNLTVSGLVKRWADALAIDEIIKRPDWVSDVSKEGFAPLANDKRFGPLAGKWVKADIVDDLKTEIVPAGKHEIYDILNATRPWYRLWKGGKVLTRPFTYLANLFSGFVMNDMAGAPIWRHSKTFVKAVKKYFGQEGSRFDEAIAHGLFGGTYAGEELSPQLLLQVGKLKNVDDALKFLGKKYSHIDNVNRFYLFNFARDKGLSPLEAVRFAHKWQLDYRRLPAVAKALRDVPIASPFVSFQYLMLPRVIETMITKPWKLMKYPALIHLWNYGFAQAHNMSMAELNNRKPLWAKDKLAVVPLGIDDNQNIIWFDMSRILPFDFWHGIPVPSLGFLKLGGVYGIIEPVVTGKTAFGEKVVPEYEEETLATKLKYGLPEGIKAALPSVYRDIVKTGYGAFGIPYGTSQKILTPAETAGAVIGAPLYSTAPDVIRKRINLYKIRISEAKKKLNKVLRSSASEAEKRKAYQEYLKYARKWNEEIRKVFASLGGAGVKAPEVKTPVSVPAPVKVPLGAFTAETPSSKAKAKARAKVKAPSLKLKTIKVSGKTVRPLKPKKVSVKLKKKPTIKKPKLKARKKRKIKFRKKRR